MRMLLISRAIVFAFLHTSGLLVASQNIPSQRPPPFSFPANSSTIVPPGTGTGVFSSSFSSTTLIGTEPTQASSTRATESSLTSDTDIPPLETSTDALSSVNTSLTPTGSVTISDSSSSSDSPITSETTSSGDTTSSTWDTVVITNGPSSTDSIILPPGPTDTSSSTNGIILPSGITLPPDLSTTLLPTGSEIQSSASDMSIIIAGIFPLLHSWIDDPQVTGITDELDNILPKASDFLGKLPKPTDGVEPCKSGKQRRAEEAFQGLQTLDKRSFLGGFFKTAFSLVTCVIDTTNKVKDGVTKGTTETVKALETELKPMVDALNEVVPNEPDPSASNSDRPSSTQLESSSSSSCTLNTVSNCKIACTATSTTTVGGARRRADGEACSTVCDVPITKCGATGTTSASTITSTTTAVQKCAKGCSKCNAPIPPPEPITGGDYLTGTNGLAYAPAPTISALPTDADIAARNIAPRETGTSSYNLYKRALTNPHDARWGGNVGDWLLETIRQPGSKNLGHGDEQPEWFSTSITEQLLNDRGSWSLGNMHGCTAVIVVSRKRMFMTHIWENPTMDNTNSNFQRDALDALRNPGGDGKGVTQGLSAFTGPGGDFENIADNHVRAMVITPYRRESSDPQHDDLEFPDQVRQIKAMLNSVLNLPDILPAIHIPYEDRGEDPLWEFPHGKILIQYDPVQAMQQTPGQDCPTQAAALEVWFEELTPSRQYGDIWSAFPNQVVAAQPGTSRRFIRGRQVTDADEEEWQEYASVLRRQNGVCVRPSGSLSASSTAQDPTTLQTSFVTTSGGGDSTDTPSTSGEPVPNTTIDQPPTTTDEPQTSTEVPEPDPTASPPPKSKALSIGLRAYRNDPDDFNEWVFFPTEVGVQANVCGNTTLADGKPRWTDHNEIKQIPWPHGDFTLTLYGEDNCHYLNDGNSAGILHCPSFGDGNNVSCQEDSEKSQDWAIIQCIDAGSFSLQVHRAAYCEW